MSSLLARAKKLEKLVQVSNMQFKFIVVNSKEDEVGQLEGIDSSDPNLHLCVLKLYAY